MYIKAKYPAVGNDYVGRQGYDGTFVDDSQKNEITDRVVDKPYKFNRVKYPVIGNEYVGFQEFGSLNGGGTISEILSQITEREIVRASTGFMFGGHKLFLFNYSGVIQNLSFANESPEWLSDNSVSVVLNINEQRAVGTLTWDLAGFWELTFVNWDN